jgi:hypothetical protein
MILPGQTPWAIVKPKGAVPKKGAELFRGISYARLGNLSIPKWGTRLFTARDLVFSLQWRSILHGFDISDGYHISMLAGCTGELVWGYGILGVRRVYEGDDEWRHPTVVGADGSEQPAPGPHGRQAIFEHGWRLHVGCDCCQTCEKSLCGMFFDGCLARWAVAHFGQAPASSPLNCIALCLLRHAALRGLNDGELRGASVRSCIASSGSTTLCSTRRWPGTRRARAWLVAAPGAFARWRRRRCWTPGGSTCESSACP